MKNLLIAAVASMAIAAPAYAQTTVGDSSSASAGATSINIPLQGTLAKKCSMSAYLNGPFDALNMESTATQGAESVSVICNYGGSSTVQFSSANAGNLKSGSNMVPYKLLVSGSGSPWDVGVSLATPQSITGWPAVANAVQTRSLSVKLDASATIAGTYTDTITASVTPN